MERYMQMMIEGQYHLGVVNIAYLVKIFIMRDEWNEIMDFHFTT